MEGVDEPDQFIKYWLGDGYEVGVGYKNESGTGYGVEPGVGYIVSVNFYDILFDIVFVKI